MSTIHTDQGNILTQEDDKEEKQIDPIALKWEEWSLSAEEHYHALTKFRENPKGRPMGHKK